MSEKLEQQMRAILDLCQDSKSTTELARLTGISRAVCLVILKNLRNQKCLKFIEMGEKTRFGWIPHYLTVSTKFTVPTLGLYTPVPRGKVFTAPENIGWLVSFPTVQPKGGRLVLLGEEYHTVGSPRKLSAWHGYNCEVMA